MYGKTLNDFPERFDEFLEEFRDTEPAALDEAFRLTRGKCKEFPTPADVRAQIREKEKSQDQFDSEKSWDLVLLVWRKHWHPDVGFYGDCPVMDGPTEHALRVIGGMRRLNDTQLEHMSFMRRDFLEAHRRYKETGGYLAPSRAEAAKLLESLTRGELPA